MLKNSFLQDQMKVLPRHCKRLKQKLLNKCKESDCLMKTDSEGQNDLKLEENRKIDREIALEKKIQQLDITFSKRGLSKKEPLATSYHRGHVGITTTNEVPSRKPIVLDSDSPKPVVKLVYSRKPRKNKNTEPVRKTKASQSSSGIGFGCTTAHDRRPLSSSPISSVNSLGYSQIGNDHVAKIMGFELFRLGSYYFKGLLR
ncbi:hypothetical protein Tco_0103620 [Tanacetum coccineum]